MKKLISLALAALLLLSLAACGDGPAPSSSGSSGDVSSSAGSSQTDVLSPVTTEEEIRALYGDDASLITSIEAYQGDFLVKLGTDEDCPSLDWVYGQSGIRRRMLWLDEPLIRCEIPYPEVGLSEDGMTLTVTMHDTFLSSGTLSKDADLDFLKEYGSLYPESFPAGELAGSCTLIENADLRQDGNSAVLTVTLADGPIHGRNFGDGYYRFTAETGYTGIADTGPYLRVILNATDELFAGN